MRLKIKFQLERETAIFIVALKSPEVEMAVEVSFSVRNHIERLLTPIVWAL